MYLNAYMNTHTYICIQIAIDTSVMTGKEDGPSLNDCLHIKSKPSTMTNMGPPGDTPIKRGRKIRICIWIDIYEILFRTSPMHINSIRMFFECIFTSIMFLIGTTVILLVNAS